MGVKIDQTNQKIDEINAKFNRDVETIQTDHERIWQQININSDKVEETAKDTVEMIKRRLGENVEETEKQMAILTTEINVEISEIRKEGESTNLKLVQTEIDINRRISDVEKTQSAQIGMIAQEQTEMKVAQSTLNEKCEEVSGKVDAIKQQVNDDKTQLTERQRRELDDIRDEMLRLRTIPNILSGLSRLEGRDQIEFRTNSKNPLEFLERIEEVIHRNRESRWSIIKGMLDESFKNAFDNWWTATRHEVGSYDTFKTAFKQKYWSEATQNIIIDVITNGKFDVNGRQSMTTYFSVSYTHLDVYKRQV